MGVNWKRQVCESGGGCSGRSGQAARCRDEKCCCFCCLLEGVTYASGTADLAESTAATLGGLGIWKERGSCVGSREGIAQSWVTGNLALSEATFHGSLLKGGDFPCCESQSKYGET